MTVEETIARAACAGFMQGSDRPLRWEVLSLLQREVFTICARAAIAQGHAHRAATGGALAVGDLAAILCDTFFETAEMQRRWSTADAGWRQVFYDCAGAVLAASRELRRVREAA